MELKEQGSVCVTWVLRKRFDLQSNGIFCVVVSLTEEDRIG